MPEMQLGDLDDRIDRELVALKLCSLLAFPASDHEREDFMSTWVAQGLGALRRKHEPLTATVRESAREAHERIVLKRNPAQVARSSEMVEAIDQIADRLVALGRYELQERAFEPAGGFEAVARAPGIDRVTHGLALGMRNGLFAGLVLATCLQIQRHHGDLARHGPSINKAIYLLQIDDRLPGLPRSESALRALWRDWSPVAPLGAGLAYAQAIAAGAATIGDAPQDAYRDFLLDHPELVLKATYGFERYALALRSFIGQPLLDAARLWRVPEFRGRKRAFEIVTRPLGPGQLMALRGYRIPESPDARETLAAVGGAKSF